MGCDGIVGAGEKVVVLDGQPEHLNQVRQVDPTEVLSATAGGSAEEPSGVVGHDRQRPAIVAKNDPDAK